MFIYFSGCESLAILKLFLSEKSATLLENQRNTLTSSLMSSKSKTEM